MGRFFIYLAYNGTRYSGWQTQPNAPSVQQTIEEALTTILRTPISLVGAGRTDAGVHAHEMIAHSDLPCQASEEAALLVDRLNKLLPRDIVIYRIVPVRQDAHARFDAVSRTYHYYLTEDKDPFSDGLMLKTYRRLDYARMNEAAALLFEYVDFTSFCKLHTDVKTNNCRVTEARWIPLEKAGQWVFVITADRFLRNMVRAIVGTLFHVGTGKLSVEDFRRIIQSQDRGQAGSSAPAHALYLERVVYPSELFL